LFIERILKMYDIVIIGSGPAGLTAAIYARRANKSVLVLEKESFGGQITYSPKVENYPGFQSASGNELAEKFMDQAMALGAEIELDTVTGIEKSGKVIKVIGESSEYEAAAVIIAAGSKHRQLGLDGENELIGEGVSYCAVCDGAFYAGKDVALVGGGNTALQEAVLLSETCKSVTIVQDLDFLTGEALLVEQLKEKDNVKTIFGSAVTGLIYGDTLEGLELTDRKTGETSFLEVGGVFVAIGQKPENEPFASVCSLNEAGYIVAGEDCLTGTDGVFAAGDCRAKAIRQVATAAGDGAAAAVAACRYIDSL